MTLETRCIGTWKHAHRPIHSLSLAELAELHEKESNDLRNPMHRNSETRSQTAPNNLATLTQVLQDHGTHWGSETGSQTDSPLFFGNFFARAAVPGRPGQRPT